MFPVRIIVVFTYINLRMNYRNYMLCQWSGLELSVKQLPTGWAVRGSNSREGEIFRIRPDRPWGPPSHLFNGYRVSLFGVKRLGFGINDPPRSIAEVKERVELYLYSPSGSAWQVIGRILPSSLHAVLH